MLGFLFISTQIFADHQENSVSCEALAFLRPSEVRKYIEFKHRSQFHGLAIYKFTGIPENEEFTVSSSRQWEKDIGFQELGRLKGEGGLSLSSEGFIPGEKVTLRLTTSDGKIIEEFALIPCPIQVSSKSGRYSINAELESLNPVLYMIDINGLKEGELFYFSPKDDVHLQSSSPRMMYCPGAGERCSKGFEYVTFIFEDEKIKVKFPYGDKILDFPKSGAIYTP